MPRRRKRTLEPIGPTNIPGEALDPRIIQDMVSPADTSVEDEHVESEEEQQARESEQALDRAATRTPPD